MRRGVAEYLLSKYFHLADEGLEGACLEIEGRIWLIIFYFWFQILVLLISFFIFTVVRLDESCYLPHS